MNIKDLLNRLNVRFIEQGSPRCREGWVQMDCPHCSRPASHWHLGYNLNGGYFHCWACGPKKTVEVLCDITGMKAGECAALTKGLEVPRKLRKQVVKGKLTLPKGIKDLLPRHIEYLEGRGFDVDHLVKHWHIRGTGRLSTHPWRLFIPIYHLGEMVSWTTRSLSDSHLNRYRSASQTEESVPHKTLLYGEDLCTHTIIIHEGSTDVWKTGPGAAGTLGTSCTKAQILKMSRYPRRVVCLDSDRAGRQRSRDLVRKLSSFDGETFEVRLDAPDPGSASEEELEALRAKFLR